MLKFCEIIGNIPGHRCLVFFSLNIFFFKMYENFDIELLNKILHDLNYNSSTLKKIFNNYIYKKNLDMSVKKEINYKKHLLLFN